MNAEEIKTFFLVATDPETECVSHESSFQVRSSQELCGVLQVDSSTLDPRVQIIDLGGEQLDRLRAYYGIDFDTRGMATYLRPKCSMDDLPYKVHTGRELALMLAGTKPLAVFSESYPSVGNESFIPEQAFDPHVAAGRIIKREHIIPPEESSLTVRGRKIGTRLVLYALPGEQWRIDAYVLMRRTAEKTGWDDGFERMEGSLLGYEDWQNDIHMEQRRRFFEEHTAQTSRDAVSAVGKPVQRGQ